MLERFGAQKLGTKMGRRSSLCLRKGTEQETRVEQWSGASRFYGRCPQKAGFSLPQSLTPAPSEERGRGAEKHLAQVQESWKRLAARTGVFFHSAPNVLQSSCAHIDAGARPGECLKPWVWEQAPAAAGLSRAGGRECQVHWDEGNLPLMLDVKVTNWSGVERSLMNCWSVHFPNGPTFGKFHLSHSDFTG